MNKRDTGKHALQSDPTRRRVMTVVVAVALLALGGGLAANLVSTGRAPAPAASTPALPSPGRTVEAHPRGTVGVAAQQAVAEAVEMCRLSNLRQEAALSRAAVSLSLWGKHVEAMNLLVAGKISLAVAHDFWDSSRVGAVDTAARFRAADRGYTALSGSACAPLSAALKPIARPSQVQALAGCTATAPRGDAALAKARIAVATWEHHIHDMEAWRQGLITPRQATVKWLKNWKAGNTQLKRYNTAVAGIAGVSCSLS